MRATKLVSNLKELPYTSRLKELKLPTLTHRRLCGDMILSFKIIKGLDDCPLENFLSFAHYDKRGHSFRLEKLRCSLSFTLNQFSHGMINVWSSFSACCGCRDIKVFQSKVGSRRLDMHWCYCDHQPKDHISPPGRLWRYITDKFTTFVEQYDNKLQKKSPTTYDIIRTIKCVRYIIADTHSYAVVSKDLWMGKELHTLTRKELEIYLEMPRHFKRIGPLLILATLPVVGNFFFAVAYFFPRQMLTHHFWSEVQRKEFMQHFHKQKVSHFPIVLDHMYKQITRHTYGTAKENFLHIIKKLSQNKQPTLEEVIAVRPSFNKFPFSVEVLPTVYYRSLAKLFDMTKRQNGLLQDALILLHTDRAMVREGFDQMTDWEIEKACYNRGLNPTDLSKEEQIEYLKMWTSITQTIDETSLSLLLHCPLLLAYNHPSNTRLMVDKKFKWRRKGP